MNSLIPIKLLPILLVVALLRLPSFFEPHWYGDEEIYLALGQMLNRGAMLYRDIWDNKTPLLYWIYGLSPTLFWAKLSATIFVLLTVLGVYGLSKKIFIDRSNFYSLLVSAMVGGLLSTPILEGNIANAELYFTLPIVLGAILVYHLLNDVPRVQSQVWLGLLMAAAFLIKVPAVFDFLGLLLGYTIIKAVDEYWSTTRNFKKLFKEQANFFLVIVFSFSVVVGLVVVYFWTNQALADFLVATLSQNASYVAVDSGPFSRLSNPLFIKALFLFLGLAIAAAMYMKRVVSKELVLLVFWFGFSLYGSLLSNRPYTHYLLQVVPVTIILVAYLWAHLRRFRLGLVVVVGVIFIVGWQFKRGFNLGSNSYYRNFFDYISERKSWEDYATYFDRRTLNYYQVAKNLRQNTDYNDPVFVWGDAAAIYVLAERPPVVKFIQAHHLTTIDKRNFDLIVQRLQKYQPKFIVVSRPVQFAFPVLETILLENYRLQELVGELYIYQKIVPTTPFPWKPQIN